MARLANPNSKGGATKQPVDTWATNKVGSTGKTQAQIDAEAGQVEAEAARANAEAVKKAAKDAADKKIAEDAVNAYKAANPVITQLPFNPATPVVTENLPFNGITPEIQNLQNQFNDFLTKQNEANTAANTAKLAKRESAVTNLTNRLKQYHLESLAPVMLSLAQQDAGEDTIMLVLSETPEYQERFKANKARITKNLSVLSPKEYLAVEDSHRQVLRAAGLTRFDNDAYVTQFMENDMSPNELSSRIDLAVNRVQNGDPDTMKQLKAYGLNPVDMVAYMLDPKQVLPEIERKVATAEIGAAGAKNKIDVNADTAGNLAARGVTKSQAEQGYAAIAGIIPDAQRLSDIYGGVQSKYDVKTGEDEVFNNLASAKRAREALISSEQGTFSASSGNLKRNTSIAGQF